MDVLKVGAVARADIAVVPLRRLDLEDVSPSVGELAHRGGTGARAGQIDHTETGKGQLVHGIGLRVLIFAHLADSLARLRCTPPGVLIFSVPRRPVRSAAYTFSVSGIIA